MNVLSDPLSSSTMSVAAGRSGYSRGGGSISSRDTPGKWKPSVFDFKFGRSSSTCPTCKGSGRIPKGQEDELVALIPYNDARLKPRRTCMYLSIVGAILLVIGGILTAFMFPRSVTISVVSVNVSKTHNNSDFWITQYRKSNSSLSAILEVETIISFHNGNFFPVTVSSLNVTMTYAQEQVGIEGDSIFHVPARISKNASIIQNITFVPPQSEKIQTFCVEDHDWRKQIYLIANVLGEYSYLAQTFAFVVNKGSYVPCSNASIILAPTTIVPPI